MPLFVQIALGILLAVFILIGLGLGLVYFSEISR